MEVFLRQTWVDPRLKYEHLSNFSNLELDQRMMANVWVPDTYFPNEKEAHFHIVTVPNRLLHISRNGTVFYSIRYSHSKRHGQKKGIHIDSPTARYQHLCIKLRKNENFI